MEGIKRDLFASELLRPLGKVTFNYYSFEHPLFLPDQLLPSLLRTAIAIISTSCNTGREAKEFESHEKTRPRSHTQGKTGQEQNKERWKQNPLER